VKVTMNYFMKNGKLHKNPAPFGCSVVREGERLFGFIPKGCMLCEQRFKEKESIE